MRGGRDRPHAAGQQQRLLPVILLVLLNADAKPVPFVLPDAHPGDAWERLIDIATAKRPATPSRLAIATLLSLEGRSLQLLRAHRRA
jgi:hypothetical protein